MTYRASIDIDPKNHETVTELALLGLGITFECESANHRPDHCEAIGPHHFKCTFYDSKASMGLGETYVFYFSQGIGVPDSPTALDVLYCLFMDASSVLGNDYESWCDDFGYNAYEWDDYTENYEPQHGATYDACEKISADLHNMLGGYFETFQELVSGR